MQMADLGLHASHVPCKTTVWVWVQVADYGLRAGHVPCWLKTSVNRRWTVKLNGHKAKLTMVMLQWQWPTPSALTKH